MYNRAPNQNNWKKSVKTFRDESLDQCIFKVYLTKTRTADNTDQNNLLRALLSTHYTEIKIFFFFFLFSATLNQIFNQVPVPLASLPVRKILSFPRTLCSTAREHLPPIHKHHYTPKVNKIAARVRRGTFLCQTMTNEDASERVTTVSVVSHSKKAKLVLPFAQFQHLRTAWLVTSPNGRKELCSRCERSGS